MAEINGEKGNKTFKIHINGVEMTVDHDTLTFEEITALAYPSADPSTIFSVTFTKARDPKEGELVAGGSVVIKNNTEFDVEDTGRS